MSLLRLQFEEQAGIFSGKKVIGTDEVGRGCLAGPVVAAAVIVPGDRAAFDLKRHPWLELVTDSKKLKPETRELLAPKIRAWATASAVRMASVDEIERLNILRASFLAMVRAYRALVSDRPADCVLLDGAYVPKPNPFACATRPIVKGDSLSLSIACASILAKVWRDQLMSELGLLYPGYGFADHKGYATPTHRAALSQKGPSTQHRLSFLKPQMDLFAQNILF